MYEATVLPALLYGAETWTAKAHDLHRLDSFHMACLRQALRISPLRHIPDTTIRAMSSSHRASSLVRLARLRWLGHVWRMEDSRIPKMILFSELTRGKRPQHRPFLRWRDCVRHDLQHFGLPTVWHILAAQRHLWRMKILSGCSDYDRALDNRAQLLRACHKGEVSASYCPACNQYFTSDRYLRSHNTQKHGLAAQDNRVQQHSAQTDLSTPFSCSVCNFTSSSTKGIKIHIRRKHPDHPAITVNITGISTTVHIVGLDKESLKLLPSLIKPTDHLCSQPDHEIEVLKFYCEACQQLTCRNFTLFYHKDHRIDEMCNIAKLTIAIDDNYNNAEQISKLKQNIKLIIDLSFKQLDHTNEENKKRLLSQVAMEAISLSKTTVLTLQKEQLVKIQDRYFKILLKSCFVLRFYYPLQEH
eukprot:Em0004g1463a